MRVCVVGCGAVGSLFAANLGDARRRRGLGLRPRARPRRGDQPRRAAPDRRGDVLGKVRATTDAAELPRVRLRHRRDQGDAHRRRDRGDRPRLRGRRGRRVQNGDRQRGGARRATCERVIRGTTFPAGKRHRPGRRPEGHQGRHDASARSRRRPAARDGGRAARRRAARAAGCRPRRSPTRAARSGAR